VYFPGQIVWSVESRKAVNCDEVNGKTRHFIDGDGKIVVPSSIKEANLIHLSG